MFDQILQLVKENAREAVIENTSVPNEKNELAVDTIANSLFDNLKGEAGAGMLNGVLEMFKGGGFNTSSLTEKLTSGAVGDLMKKVGIDQATAENIVGRIIPVVMDKLVKKTNDPSDKSIDLDGIIGSLTGGKGDDLMGSLKGLFGK
jgi:hypothetical protein